MSHDYGPPGTVHSAEQIIETYRSMYESASKTTAIQQETIAKLRADLAAKIACVNEMAETCGRYAERVKELEAKLREWVNAESQIGPHDTIVGPPTRLIEETERLLEG